MSTPSAQYELNGPRVAIVTGAARGLGLGVAARLLADRMAVTMADVDQGVIAAATENQMACAVICDVSDAAQVDALVKSTIERFGRLDLFVANAGVGGGGPVVEMTDEAYRRIIGVNLDGAFFSCRAAAQAMIPARTGCILTV